MSLTLIYIKADELLYTFPVLQLSGAVAGILTWLSKGTLRFSHLFVHSSQTQPGVKRRKQKGERFGYSFPDGSLRAELPYRGAGRPWLHSQGDDVRVGRLDSDAERVLPVAIHRVLVCASLEEQADLTAGGKEKTIRGEISALSLHTGVGRGHFLSLAGTASPILVYYNNKSGNAAVAWREEGVYSSDPLSVGMGAIILKTRMLLR